MSDQPDISLEHIRALLERFLEQNPGHALDVIELLAGEVLFREGDEPDAMYWVQDGTLEARSASHAGEGQLVSMFTDGHHVGEMALLSGLQRTATVTALEASRLYRVTHDDLVRFANHDVDLINRLNDVAAKRWRQLFLTRCLKELFGELPHDDMLRLQDELEWIDLANGDILFHENDVADGVYIVISGRLHAKVSMKEGDRVVGDIGPADFVGEYAMLTDEPRSATVYATRNTSVAKMPLSVLDEYITSNPVLMRKIAHRVIQRQKKMLRGQGVDGLRTLSAAILVHDSLHDVSDFVQSLGEQVGRYGESLFIDSAGFDTYFGQEGVAESPVDGPVQPVIAARLNELESQYQNIFFIVDDADSSWAHRAIGQSDRLILLADAAAEPVVSDLERLSGRQAVPVRMDLVLLHAEDIAEPSGTMNWLSQRNVTDHYHVRRNDETHLARLARRLTGNAIAFVCSGGGARGYAQLGVYRSLLELDIPVDYIAGTSMGSITAGGIACGYSYEEAEKLLKWTADLGVVDLTLPLASLASSKNVTRICQHVYGERQIEDLWIPYVCISTNLTKAERVEHRTGSMWRAIRASMSIPGVFLPIIEDGDVLVDGGVMDNYPVVLLAELAETDRLIGVNVNPYIERSVRFDYDTSLSGWRLLLNRLNPFTRRMKTPSVMGTILRSLDVNSMRDTKLTEKHLSVSIKPDIRKFSMNDYARWREIAEVGYQDSFDRLRAWKQDQSDL